MLRQNAQHIVIFANLIPKALGTIIAKIYAKNSVNTFVTPDKNLFLSGVTNIKPYGL